MNIYSHPLTHPGLFRDFIRRAMVLLAFVMLGTVTLPAQADTKAWKEYVVFHEEKLSVDVSDVSVGELFKEIGHKAEVRVIVDAALEKQRVTVSFNKLTVEEGIQRIVRILGLPDLAMSYKPAKGPNGKSTWAVDFAQLLGRNKKNVTFPVITVKDIQSLIIFINLVGSQGDCEQTYWALSSLSLSTKAWWQKERNFKKLLEAAKNPAVATCARMASVELYLSKLSKEDLQKISPDIQTDFIDAGTPDKLSARIMQLLAERDVPPTQMIEAVLENDTRGQSARTHAWYAAGRSQLFTPHLLDMAMMDANSAGTAQSASGKMALEYMAKLPQASVEADVESKVSGSVLQAVNRAMALPNDSGLNELGRSMAAISAIPRFVASADVVSLLGQVILKSANDDVKLTAIDVLAATQANSPIEVAAQAKYLTDNLKIIFPDPVSRTRAKVRLDKLGTK